MLCVILDFLLERPQNEHLSAFSSSYLALALCSIQTNVRFEAFLVGNQGWRIKGQMLRYLIWYPKNISRFIRPVHVHLKTDHVDYLKKPSYFVFAYFCNPSSSSQHEKCCRMLVRLFWLFQCSRIPQCSGRESNREDPSLKFPFSHHVSA